MFCGKCGAQNEDGATFCKECGAPLTADAPTPAQAPADQNGQNVTVAGNKLPVNRNQLIGIVAVAAVVLVVIIIIASLLGGGGSQGVAEKYVNAMYKGDGKTVVNLMPKEFIEEMCDKRDIDKGEMIEDMNDTLELMIDALDDEYDKWSVSAKATKAKDLSDKKIEELEDRYENSLDVDMDIQAAQEVTLEITVKADGDKETEKVKLTVIKVGGKWYMDYFSYVSMGRIS